MTQQPKLPGMEVDAANGPVDMDNLQIERKTDFILSKHAEDTLLKLTTELAIDRDTRVSRSHLIRAVCIVLERNRDRIVNQVRAVGLGKRPPNGAHAARHAYETRLANAICEAVVLNRS